MPAAPSQRRGRRSGSATRAPLDRQVIVVAALDLLQREGVERLTMRRLADALQTGPASIYVYFRDTAQLHAALLDRLLEAVDLQPATDGGGTWQDRLAAVLSSYAGVLFAYPSVAKVSLFTRHRGPNGFRVLEAILALLEEGGIAPGVAAWGADQLAQYVITTAAEQSVRDEMAEAQDHETDLERVLTWVDPEATPRLFTVRATLLAGTEQERFRWGIDVILAGLADKRNGALPATYSNPPSWPDLPNP